MSYGSVKLLFYFFFLFFLTKKTFWPFKYKYSRYYIVLLDDNDRRHCDKWKSKWLWRSDYEMYNSTRSLSYVITTAAVLAVGADIKTEWDTKNITESKFYGPGQMSFIFHLALCQLDSHQLTLLPLYRSSAGFIFSFMGDWSDYQFIVHVSSYYNSISINPMSVSRCNWHPAHLSIRGIIGDLPHINKTDSGDWRASKKPQYIALFVL